MNRPAQVIVGAKLPLRPMHVWAIRVRLQIERRFRDLALFDIALDSKLRGCDVVALRLPDVLAAGVLRRRAIIIQQKTGRPVQFEITEQTRRSLAEWLKVRRGEPNGWLFPSRMIQGAHVSTRQYIRLLKRWITLIGLEPAEYGTHSLRRDTNNGALQDATDPGLAFWIIDLSANLTPEQLAQTVRLRLLPGHRG